MYQVKVNQQLWVLQNTLPYTLSYYYSNRSRRADNLYHLV